ncbi:hypothetical protein L7F22_038338 [Adiantum nelumboides]|nr:hypothetical protein [Adiantum nelumboides]
MLARSGSRSHRLESGLRLKRLSSPHRLSHTKMDFEKEEQQHLQQCEDEGDQRGWVSSDVIRDAIIGLSDGLTVPFALTAGLSGTGNPRLIVVAGLRRVGE